MIDFPASPTIGQTFDPGTGIVYSYDGVAWNAMTTSTATARRQNLIVNPSMQVSQENGTAAGTAVGYYIADQWAMFATAGMVCSGQLVASPTPDGSTWRLRKTVTTLKASLAASDISTFTQFIEGACSIVNIGFGTAAAFQLVLRFGFKGPAGTYSFTIRNGATLNRSYVKNFTIAAGQANIDTLQTFVIPGDTTGTWDTSTAQGLSFAIYDAVGTTYQGTDGVWQAGDIRGTAANSNMVATNGNIVELFDVGLYPDPQRTGLAPPFIQPDYATELVKCMRYFQGFTQMVIDVSTVAQSFTCMPMRIIPTVTGGGAGFTTQKLNTNSGQFYQTTRAYQNIVLNARM